MVFSTLQIAGMAVSAFVVIAIAVGLSVLGSRIDDSVDTERDRRTEGLVGRRETRRH